MQHDGMHIVKYKLVGTAKRGGLFESKRSWRDFPFGASLGARRPAHRQSRNKVSRKSWDEPVAAWEADQIPINRIKFFGSRSKWMACMISCKGARAQAW